MSRLTPTQARDKHARRVAASGQDMIDGVQAVTEAPGKKAAAKSAKMLRNLTEAVNSGKWAKNVGAITLEEWKGKMIDKGVPRVAAGVTAAADKIEAFYAKLFPHQDRLKAEIDKMADLTLEDSVNRAAAWIRGMAKFENG